MRSRSAVAAVVALSLLAACDDEAGSGTGPPDPADPPTVYGGARPVTLLRPATITPGARYPLVLVLHGYGSSGALQSLYFQFTGLGTDPGAFVLAPDGTVDGMGNRFWDANEVCCGFSAPDVDDVAYLGGLVDAVAADWPVDPARVFVVGHSNGAFMAYRLACERSDVIAAIAGLAGAATVSGCDSTSPVSVLHVHGTADGVVEYAGGAFLSGAYPGARASTSAWAGLDGCAATWTAAGARDLETTLEGDETAVETADGCPAGVAVELWTIAGGGHVPSLVPGFGGKLVEWLQAHPRR
jgi:polyhydroxybutyrate depolymerase